MKDCYYQVTHTELLTPNVSRILLSHCDGSVLRFEAGQYLKILLSDDTTAPFSIAAAPSLPLELHLGHQPGNTSAGELRKQLTINAKICVHGPFGSITPARFDLHQPIIFFVRGTGFAPVKAILEAFTYFKALPPIHLYWGAASADDFYLQTRLKQLEHRLPDFRYTLAVSRSKDQHKLHHIVLQDYPDLSQQQIYASGATEMVLSSRDIFLQHGLRKEYFYSDVFDYVEEN
jgi:CDP-4-dehydro-6-deoxyglucose reductase